MLKENVQTAYRDYRVLIYNKYENKEIYISNIDKRERVYMIIQRCFNDKSVREYTIDYQIF